MTYAKAPLVLLVQKLSSYRPAAPEFSRETMTRYRKEPPCPGAVWKRKLQWWVFELGSLEDLVEFQKDVGHSVTLGHGKELTINDLPLSIDNGEGVCG